jgi:hypothetical protein
VRKFTAIILLTAFVASQYARHISFFECKLANYFKASTERCDCEKIIGEKSNSADQDPLPVVHNHFHLDESYCPPGKSETDNHSIDSRIIYSTAHFTLLITEGFFGSVDRPPQMG